MKSHANTTYTHTWHGNQLVRVCSSRNIHHARGARSCRCQIDEVEVVEVENASSSSSMPTAAHISVTASSGGDGDSGGADAKTKYLPAWDRLRSAGDQLAGGSNPGRAEYDGIQSIHPSNPHR